jgi:hypothetical protein
VYLYATDTLSFSYCLDNRFGSVVDMHDHTFTHTLVEARPVANDRHEIRIGRIAYANNTANHRCTNIKADVGESGRVTHARSIPLTLWLAQENSMACATFWPFRAL